MTQVTVDAPLSALPDLVRRAVGEVPRAALIELTDDGALVGRRASTALGAETTRFTFRARPGGGCVVRARSVNTLVFGYVGTAPDAVIDTGRAVLDALVRAAADAAAGEAPV